MALQEQFGDSRCRAKVAVNLERSAQIEEVRQRFTLEKSIELAEGDLAVTHARPERNAPGVAPASAAVPAPFQQNFGGSENVRVGLRDVVAGIQRPER